MSEELADRGRNFL